MAVLVTGATGYIGGRLVPRLLKTGHKVRIFVRDARRLAGRPWANEVEVVTGNLADFATLGKVLDGVDVAYFLVHTMYAGRGFKERDKHLADDFGRAAAKAGVKHLIYLGGLVPKGAEVSEHLTSRAEVGKVLARHLPTTEFRAGPIIGSGSASFEMVRYLTERLPVMIAPRWVTNEVEPVAVRDVLAYLIYALSVRPNAIVDIGGGALTFRDMMHGYASARGLKRKIFPVPVLAPQLAARWVGLVTPIPNTLAVPLVKGIVRPLVADTTRAHELFPMVEPIGYYDAVERALGKVDEQMVETHWSGAISDAHTYELTDEAGLIREERTILSGKSSEKLYASLSSIGGQQGWLTWEWAWRIRGLIDVLIGGPGLRRGRRHPTELLAGEALDFWRVEAVEPGKLLRLRAEMKVPGEAWLQWRIFEEGEQTRLMQTAYFRPKGFWGFLYWYSLAPIHGFIFGSLLNAIERKA